jgi:hypothetical protein
MPRELPRIDFASQAQVRTEAERRRTEEITGLLKPIFKGWAARFRRKPIIVSAVRFAPVSARTGN